MVVFCCFDALLLVRVDAFTNCLAPSPFSMAPNNDAGILRVSQYTHILKYDKMTGYVWRVIFTISSVLAQAQLLRALTIQVAKRLILEMIDLQHSVTTYAIDLIMHIA